MRNNKGLPFVYKGVTDVTDCITSEEVMIKAGLDWEVAKCELYGKMPGLIDNNFEDTFLYNGDNYSPCPNAYGTFRSDNNRMLGVVKDRYTPVQNIDAFNFFDDAIGKNDAIWQTAGCFDGGRRVFVSAKLPNNILINGEDPVDNYLVFMTSHDGSMGIKILLTPIRVICQNMLNAAIQSSSSYITFRHTKSVHNTMDLAGDILGISKMKILSVSEHYNRMNTIKFSDLDAQNLFAKVVLNENDLLNLQESGYGISDIINRNGNALRLSEISSKKMNVLEKMNTYYHIGNGQPEIIGTGWGVYNAITGYYSNIDNTEGSRRMDTLLYGDRSRKIELAGNLILSA